MNFVILQMVFLIIHDFGLQLMIGVKWAIIIFSFFGGLLFLLKKAFPNLMKEI